MASLRRGAVGGRGSSSSSDDAASTSSSSDGSGGGGLMLNICQEKNLSAVPAATGDAGAEAQGNKGKVQSN